MNITNKLKAGVLCALFAISLTVSGCSGNAIQNAYKADVALSTAYKVAAPLRAELCRDPKPLLDLASCDKSLKVLKVHFALITNMTALLAQYESSKDQAVENQIVALYPQLFSAIGEITTLINDFKK